MRFRSHFLILIFICTAIGARASDGASASKSKVIPLFKTEDIRRLAPLHRAAYLEALRDFMSAEQAGNPSFVQHLFELLTSGTPSEAYTDAECQIQISNRVIKQGCYRYFMRKARSGELGSCAYKIENYNFRTNCTHPDLNLDTQYTFERPASPLTTSTEVQGLTEALRESPTAHRRWRERRIRSEQTETERREVKAEPAPIATAAAEEKPAEKKPAETPTQPAAEKKDEKRAPARAPARVADDPDEKDTVRCFFGGFMIMNHQGNKASCAPLTNICSAPRAKTFPPLRDLKAEFCSKDEDPKGICPNPKNQTPTIRGIQDKVVCNPLLYGTDNDGAVHCVPATKNASQKCREKSKNGKDPFELLAKPKMGEAFDKMIEAIGKHCRDTGVGATAADQAREERLREAARRGHWSERGIDDMKETCKDLYLRVEELSKREGAPDRVKEAPAKLGTK